MNTLRITLSLFLLCFSLNLSAQVIATTEDGKKVVLKKDGTWQYLEDYMKAQSSQNTEPTSTAEASQKPTPSTPKAVTMDDFKCEQIIGTKLNKMTQKDYQALADAMVISEVGDEHKFSMVLGVNDNKTYTWDLTISGTSGCATQTPSVTLTLVNGKQIKLGVENDFVCDKQVSLFLSRGLGNKGDLKALRATPIQSIQVETRSGTIEEDLSLEQGVMLQKAFNCLEGR